MSQNSDQQLRNNVTRLISSVGFSQGSEDERLKLLLEFLSKSRLAIEAAAIVRAKQVIIDIESTGWTATYHQIKMRIDNLLTPEHQDALAAYVHDQITIHDALKLHFSNREIMFAPMWKLVKIWRKNVKNSTRLEDCAFSYCADELESVLKGK